MVFLLDSELINDGPGIDGFYDFVQNIFLAYKEGKHIVGISARDATILIKDSKVDEVSRKILRYYLAHDRANINLIDFFPIIIKVVASQEETICSNVIGRQEVRNLNFSRLVDSANIQKTILLGENGNDSEIYALFSEYYKTVNNLSICELRYKRQTGGGSTTVSEFKSIYDKGEEFCVCLLDSDRKIPKRGIGATARHVVNFCQENNLLKPNYKCHHHVIDALEVENILPLGFYKEVYCEPKYSESHSRYKFLEDNELVHLNHLDFKVGVKTLHETNDNEICQFWFEVISKHDLKVICTEDSNFYLKGFGNNVLSSFLQYDKQKVFKEVDQTPRLREQWLNIGAILSSFILGTRTLRAI